jgi:Right handed beta helix region
MSTASVRCHWFHLAAAGMLLCLISACSGVAGPETAPPAMSGQSSASEPAPQPACEIPTARRVSTAEELRTALTQAEPGAVIYLLDGVYRGEFQIRTAGTADRPITLCGGRGATLDGGPVNGGYTLHLLRADHWRLAGFTIKGGQKGLMLDTTSFTVIDGLLIHDIGDEALHLRSGSSSNVVRRTVIRRTGLRSDKFGEGIYVGSAESNWCQHSGCGPDRSDRNVIEGNDIAETAAECVDIKEGTTGGILRGNRFSGAGMTAADSWVDVKGNNWTINHNTGTDSRQDGFQVHVIMDGWGEGNVFEHNTATVNGPGFAINVTKRDRGNRVTCSNRAVGAASGLSTVDCR